MKKLFACVLLFAGALPVFGQAISSNGGAIQGTITDPSGAAIPGAQVVITDPAIGYTHTMTSDSAGFYSVGPLTPGSYTITITAANFQRLKEDTVVRVGTATNGSAKLSIGTENETVEVNAGQLQVNTDQAGVQDVLTRQQVESLPINGRNFLDLAQVQPGVILQSGETFDPTKAGYSAISVDGVSGRTTRILYDGQDITDETVGTTIINIPTGAVDEFQLNRSTQDVSGEVTSTGQVLVAAPSGTNQLHGQLFYNFQDNRALFADTADANNTPFQRNQFGGYIGGPILKDKLFFYGGAERIKQDQQASAIGTVFRDPANIAGDPYLTTPILVSFPTLPEPFRDTFSMARLDYSGPFGGHYFVRAFYEDNAAFGNYGALFSTYSNRDNVPGLAGGADFAFGHWTHSFRGGYEKFHNLIADTTVGNSSIYNPTPGIELADGADGFYSGPNYLAPQETYQSDKQFRYDGTWTHGKHTLKFGGSVNKLLGGGGAAFFGLAPQVGFDSDFLLPNCNNNTALGPCPGDPLNGYNAQAGITFGNGNGAFTEQPGFGLPGGGLHDWRSAYYFADTWKITPSVTVIGGIRYSIDTDRANQDLPVPPCQDALNAGFTLTCTGNQPLLLQFGPNLGTRVHQPYGNIAPQAGLVFSPGAHKLSVRIGGGIFYESDIFNNTSNARPPVLNANGAYFGDAGICGNNGYSIPVPGGSITSATVGGTTLSVSDICALPISQSYPYIENLNAQYQKIEKGSTGPNGSYIANYMSTVVGAPYASNYRTPYSVQLNGGFQYEVAKGTIFSADYIHNGTIHIPLLIDENHTGAANTLNTAAAKNAIANTLAYCNAASINAAIAPGGCAPSASAGGTAPTPYSASIVDFASNGLDSLSSYLSNLPAQFFGLTPATGAAFPGINTAVGQGEFINPTGQSGYDALQIVLKEIRNHPTPGLTNVNVQVSYSLSRAVSDIGGAGLTGAGAADQFFNSTSWDMYDPKTYTGRNNNDHTNELSFGGALGVKYGAQVGIIGHFFSAGATSLTLPQTGQPGEIFRTDVTGDGTTGDLVPGSEVGAYMHQVKPGSLGGFINNYNSSQAGTLTPAGQALVNAGLFSSSQLMALGAVKPTLQNAPSNGGLPNAAFRAFDTSVNWPIPLGRFREGLSIVPGIAFYNVFNMANFNRLTGTLQSADQKSPTRLNGANTYAVEDGLRVQRGSGTFDQGGPRTTEFQLKLNF